MDRQFTAYGPGDPQTWGFRQPDEDGHAGETWYEQAARLIEEAREELAIAEDAAMHRDEEKFRVAMLNAKDVIKEIWND